MKTPKFAERFLTLFAYSLPFPQLLRVWDHFLCRGMKSGSLGVRFCSHFGAILSP